MRVVKGDELREFGQILLNHGRIVFQEEVVQILWDEGGERGKSDGLVVEVKGKKRRAERI